LALSHDVESAATATAEILYAIDEDAFAA